MKQDPFKELNQQLVKPAYSDKVYLNGIITGAVAMLGTLILLFAAIIFTAWVQS